MEEKKGGNVPAVVAEAEAKAIEARTKMLAVREEMRGDMDAYAPRSHTEALQIASTLFKSKLLPDDIQSPEAAYLIMAKGASLGFDALTAFDLIYIVKGRPTLGAQGRKALIEAHPDTEYFFQIESTDDHATYAAKRKGRPEYRYTYYYKQAESAGINKTRSGSLKDNWKNYRREMLCWRCITRVANEYFPDIIAGIKAVLNMDNAGRGLLQEAEADTDMLGREEAPVPIEAVPVDTPVSEPVTKPEPEKPLTPNGTPSASEARAAIVTISDKLGLEVGNINELIKAHIDEDAPAMRKLESIGKLSDAEVIALHAAILTDYAAEIAEYTAAAGTEAGNGEQKGFVERF